MNRVRRLESVQRADFRCTVHNLTRQCENFAYRFIEETIKVIKERRIHRRATV